MNIHEMEIQVRYTECDPMGIAHHGVYATWFEMGRTELLRERGIRYRDLEDENVFIVVAKLEIKYKKTTRYDDVLNLKTCLVNLARAKMEFTYELFRDKELLATGVTTLACLDEAGNILPVPGAIRVAFIND